jgi:hypothetical protein
VPERAPRRRVPSGSYVSGLPTCRVRVAPVSQALRFVAEQGDVLRGETAEGNVQDVMRLELGEVVWALSESSDGFGSGRLARHDRKRASTGMCSTSTRSAVSATLAMNDARSSFATKAFPICLGLVSHRDGPRQRFDETTAGLDHLSFAVPDRFALERWCAQFDELSVEYTPTTNANSVPGAVVVFRDPDNIQLELFVDTA